MTLQQLHYAIIISECGSFNKAANQLYLSQPSLTSAISQLENELGIVIFTRSGRGITLTQDGAEFLLYARQVYSQYEALTEKYGKGQNIKKKFAVSSQHYSFAVKAFVEMAKSMDARQYEFAIRETTTRDVIHDVANLRSEIGILYLSDFNRAVLGKMLNANDLEFHHLINCSACVYLWSGHPLAGRSELSLADLAEYPCVCFEQGAESSLYFAEEILSTREYPQIIRANDRATNLNLMVGLNGYTLCSGIICSELNGGDYVAVPFRDETVEESCVMDIGYIVRKNTILSNIGARYIEEIRKYLGVSEL